MSDRLFWRAFAVAALLAFLWFVHVLTRIDFA